MLEDKTGIEVHLKDDYADTVDKVTAELSEEGFGVLTRIDVKQAFKEKIGEDFRPYVILGACNPDLAYRALSRTSQIGLMLPCNVTVEEEPAGGSIVRIIKPEMMLKMGDMEGDEVLTQVAREATERLQRVARSLEKSTVSS